MERSLDLNPQISLRKPVLNVSTWHDDLVAGHTLGGELVAVAVVAEQGVLLAGERLVRQRAVAAETAEAVLVVMPVLVEELLATKQRQESQRPSNKTIVKISNHVS